MLYHSQIHQHYPFLDLKTSSLSNAQSYLVPLPNPIMTLEKLLVPRDAVFAIHPAIHCLVSLILVLKAETLDSLKLTLPFLNVILGG